MYLDMVLSQIHAKTCHSLSKSIQFHIVHSFVTGSHQDVGCHIVKLFFDDAECPQITTANLKSIIYMGPQPHKKSTFVTKSSRSCFPKA